MLKNTKTHYGSVSRFFHWFLFFLIVTLLAVGFLMDELKEPFKWTVYTLHKSTGLLVLGLMLLRLSWRLYSPPPALPKTLPAWQKKAAQTMHRSLYLLLILMPLSGWIMSSYAGKPPVFYGLITIPFPGISFHPEYVKLFKKIHEYIAFILIGLISLHTLAGLRDLKRMLRV